MAGLLQRSQPHVQTATEDLHTRVAEVHALIQRRELRAAWEALGPMLVRWPQSADVQNLKAIAAVQLGKLKMAERIWRNLLAEQPGYANARTNLGNLLLERGQGEAAIALLQQTVSDHPNHADAHMSLGVAYFRSKLFAQALLAFERSLALKPNNVQAVFNMGKLLQEQNDLVGAHARYRQALEIDPTFADAAANLALTQHYLPDFDPVLNRETARMFASQSPKQAPIRRRGREVGEALRVGLVSADLRTHPVGYFLDALLAQLNRQALHLVAYSHNAYEDALTQRLKAHCSAWRRIDMLSDAETAALIENDEVDILIDLSGFTAGNRQGVFSLRPAPVQLSWLGYFSTTGNPAIDCVLADPICVPPEEEQFFVEKIWRLPHIRYCFTPPENASSVALLPAKFDARITFGSFQTLPKINARVLRCWARILQAVPTARLRIQNSQIDNPDRRAHLEQELEQFQLPRERVELVGQQTRASYLSAYAGVDIVLDTFPYPGGTTTAEALWMGVPTLTLALPGMLGRQGEAMLGALGLDEWIARSEDDYVSAAIAWGRADRSALEQLAELRAGLRQRATHSPLFDAPRFARDFERALQQLWQTRDRE